MGRKEGAALPLLWGDLDPHLTQCGLGRDLLPYQVASSSIQSFGHNRHGPKVGCVGAVPFFLGKLGPHLTQVTWAEAYLHSKWHLSPSSRLTTKDMGRKLGAVPLRAEELGPHLAQCRLGGGLPPYQVGS